MANLTDPLAAAVHGTDPQSLMEYITRQKIYDSRYWKEECFGLTAVNVLEKAANQLHNIGASFGGNAQPTRFLSLILKLLQIQPDQDLVNELIQQEDFKYVRVLAAFYKRLTGRPADIYEQLEPLLRDYRKLKYRDVTEWKLIHVDEFIHQLLTLDRVCGIALPRLAARTTLEEEGYLDGPYISPLQAVIDESHGSSYSNYLDYKVKQGSVAAKQVWDQRNEVAKQKQEEQRRLEEARMLIRENKAKFGRRQGNDNSGGRDDNHHGRRRDGGRGDDLYAKRDNGGEHDVGRPNDRRGFDDDGRKRQRHDHDRPDARDDTKKKKPKQDKKYGSLFKSNDTKSKTVSKTSDSKDNEGQVDEESEEYWNEQRAKLGLKPLKK